MSATTAVCPSRAYAGLVGADESRTRRPEGFALKRPLLDESAAHAAASSTLGLAAGHLEARSKAAVRAGAKENQAGRERTTPSNIPGLSSASTRGLRRAIWSGAAALSATRWR